eukprot:Phypoly_transcript_09899.p1 GENE.Phypoly_transcript_09899~~Phypoly_transcript_09899.p1  ORF type:complete len:181 (+),score=25.46 Phypoly_transcript_09899:682-1224(+)
MGVRLWPFFSLSNSLIITMASGFQGQEKSCVDESTDQSGNLRWVIVVVDGVSLYGQFLDKGVLDDRVRTVQYSLSADKTTVTATVPHFWDYIDLDPNFSVLVAANKKDLGICHDNKKDKTKLAIEIVVPVVVGLILIAGLVFLFRNRILTALKVRKMRRVPTSDVKMDSMHSESRDSMRL